MLIIGVWSYYCYYYYVGDAEEMEKFQKRLVCHIHNDVIMMS